MTALANWVASKPGPFSGRSHDAVWDSAWQDFNKGPTGGLYNDVLFRAHLMQAGYGIRTLAVGGFALDRIT